VRLENIDPEAAAPPRSLAASLSEEMSEAADRLSVPVLLTAYDVPFTAISRAMAEANRGGEHARLVQAVRVYETALLAVSGSSFGESLMARLSKVTRCDFFVLDPERGRSLLPDVSRMPRKDVEDPRYPKHHPPFRGSDVGL
jgi:hypothetical protein